MILVGLSTEDVTAWNPPISIKLRSLPSRFSWGKVPQEYSRIYCGHAGLEMCKLNCTTRSRRTPWRTSSADNVRTSAHSAAGTDNVCKRASCEQVLPQQDRSPPAGCLLRTAPRLRGLISGCVCGGGWVERPVSAHGAEYQTRCGAPAGKCVGGVQADTCA
jgi:hypothetical protein